MEKIGKKEIIMKLAALFSGGKDSTFSLYKALNEGHYVKYLVSIFSKNPESYMYHTENIKLVKFQANALGISLVSEESLGEKEKELEDLKRALLKIRDEIDGVVSGAIESEYQKSRIHSICDELNLKLFSPLWNENPKKILEELIDLEFNVMITSVKAEGFSKEWLGRRMDKNCLKDLLKLRKKYGIHLSGEGGEYETFVLDGPIFEKRIEIIEWKKQWDEGMGVGRFLINKVRLIKKEGEYGY
jgi:ABC transporter with metal-binding/Fe-S-binding domain ATP-binding protein